MAPGTPSLATIDQSMFLNRQCDRPDAKVVAYLGQMDRGAGLRGRHTAEYEQGRRGNPEGHAQGTVDELGTDTDEGKDDERTNYSSFRSGRRRGQRNGGAKR